MAKSGDGKHSGRLASSTLNALSELDALFAQFDALRGETFGDILPARPQNSITYGEYAERYGVSDSTAQRQLAEMSKVGKIKRYMAYVPDARQRMVATQVYVPVQHHD